MPVPKKRHSTARQGKRRAAHRYVLPRLVVCLHCKTHIPSHTVCPNCFMYKGVNFAKIEQPKNAEEKDVAKEKKEEVKKPSQHDFLQDKGRPKEAAIGQKKIGRVHRKPDSS